MNHTLPCEAVPAHTDFRRLSSIAGLKTELRYATSDNFVGRDLYSPLDCAWLHRDAAAALALSARWLAKEHPGLSMLVLDALRPQRVQEQLWAALQGTDLLGYLANPVQGSIHSFGMAVDITLIDTSGRELDMGTPFDDLTALSHPALEAQFLENGQLTTAQVNNRNVLRDTMRHGGFTGIRSEWWHFDCGERSEVRANYLRVT